MEFAKQLLVRPYVLRVRSQRTKNLIPSYSVKYQRLSDFSARFEK